MATTTPNYGLTKPAATDFYDVSVQNGNMDKIDTALKDKESIRRTRVNNNVSAAGWYKIGTISPTGSDHTTSARLSVGGSYYYTEPPTAIIDIVTQNYNAYSKVIVTNGLETQISKIGLIKSADKVYDVYAYYNNASINLVLVTVDMLSGRFTPVLYEAADVSESNMSTVAYVNEWDNPPLELGVEYRTTERWNGKVVYAKAVYFGSMPNSTNASLYIADGITDLVRVEGFVVQMTTFAPFTTVSFVSEVTIIGGTHLQVSTTQNASGWYGYPIVYYCKG